MRICNIGSTESKFNNHIQTCIYDIHIITVLEDAWRISINWLWHLRFSHSISQTWQVNDEAKTFVRPIVFDTPHLGKTQFRWVELLCFFFLSAKNWGSGINLTEIHPLPSKTAICWDQPVAHLRGQRSNLSLHLRFAKPQGCYRGESNPRGPSIPRLGLASLSWAEIGWSICFIEKTWKNEKKKQAWFKPSKKRTSSPRHGRKTDVAKIRKQLGHQPRIALLLGWRMARWIKRSGKWWSCCKFLCMTYIDVPTVMYRYWLYIYIYIYTWW